MGALTAIGAATSTLPTPAAALRAVRRRASVAELIDDVMLAVASFALWAVIGWSAAMLLGLALRTVPGPVGRWGAGMLRRITPAAVRRVVLLAAGVGLAGGLTACGQPSHSAPATSTVTIAAEADVAVVSGAADAELDLDWIIDPPSAAPATAIAEPAPTGPGTATAFAAETPSRGALPPADAAYHDAMPVPVAAAGAEPVSPRGVDAASAHRAVIVVAPGDTLWSIAARHLPADAAAAAVDAAWRTWYTANADVIGSDPDVIVPGQRLVVPAEAQR